MKGWVKSNFKGCGAAGETFEQLLGKPVENSENPDFLGIEIKTHKYNGKFPITLFRAKPVGKSDYQTKYLVEHFGSDDKKFPNRKNLGGIVTTRKKTKFSDNSYFQLSVDEKNKLIKLLVYDKNDSLIYDEAYWTFETLKNKLKRKLSILCYIESERKYEHSQVFFKYNAIDFFYLKDFNNFIRLVKNGIITINFCVYVYSKGKRLGEIHDHGTSFRIYPNNISKLFHSYQPEEEPIFSYFMPFTI